MTGRCRGYYQQSYQPYQPYQPQQPYSPPTFHNPIITSNRELSGGRHEIRFSGAPSGQLISILTDGRTFTDGSAESGSHSFNIADNLVSYGSFSSSGFVIRREGNEFIMTIGSNLTGGNIQIGNHTINVANLRNRTQQPVVPELQAPIQGGGSSPVTGTPTTPTTPATPPASTDPIQRILDGLSVSTPQEDQRQTYGGVIAFNAPVGTVSIRYESSSGNGTFNFSRSHSSGPLEANANGVAYIQASPNAYRQVGSGCGSHLIPTQNHFGIGIDPNFRGTIIVSINGRERRLEYPIPATTPSFQNPLQRPDTPPIPELANPIRPGEFVPVNPTDIPILATSNTLTLPAVTSLNIPTAITNFTALQNSFPSTLERGTHWANTDDREQRRRIATFMRQYATNIATSIRPDGPNIRVGDRTLTPTQAREHFEGLSEQYRAIYNSYGL